MHNRVNWTRQPEPIVTEGEPGSFDTLFTAWPSFLLPLADTDSTAATAAAAAAATAADMSSATAAGVSSASAADTIGSAATGTVAATAAVGLDALQQRAQSTLVPSSSGSGDGSSVSLLYHTLNVEPDKPMYFMIGRAVSDDNGETWRKTGRIPLQNFGADSNRGHGGRCVRTSNCSGIVVICSSLCTRCLSVSSHYAASVMVPQTAT
jgi:hypothetical protein